MWRGEEEVDLVVRLVERGVGLGGGGGGGDCN